MCGIVAVAARRDCTDILLEGLRMLEYRGYDSAWFSLIDREGQLSSHKTLGRVAALEAVQLATPLSGGTGICLLYTSPSPRDRTRSRMPSSA